MIQTIWSVFEKEEVDLFALEDNFHCPTYFSKEQDALVHNWPNVHLYAFPLIALFPQVIRRVREVRCSPLADTIQDSPSLPSERLDLVSPARAVEPSCLVPRQESLQLSARVTNTILEARAPSTRCLYALKWSVFSVWFAAKNKDPSLCDMSSVLTFLQELLDKGCIPSTLKVYVAAIKVNHPLVADHSVGNNNLVVKFLRGACQSAYLQTLSLKTALFLALASVKRVGDLQAFSVSASCLEFGSNDCKVILKPRHGYVPKAFSTS